jgi:eukaryotic-like serine/threonine-protein kinase
MDDTVPVEHTDRIDLPSSFGRYQVDGYLGGGGMGHVYRAVDPILNRPVAIKTLRTGVDFTQEMAARFEQEGRAAARINHPGVVQVYDQGLAGGTIYLVLEFVPGGSLRGAVLARGPLEGERWTSLAKQLLEALEAVHAGKLLHRDIKPANVFLTARGTAKLGDFGIAHVESDLNLTETGDLLGTVAYMAPECTEGHPATERSDLYSLGRTLLFAATGELRPQELPPSFPGRLQDWLDTLTARDPDRRVPAASAALTSLQQACLDRPPRRSHRGVVIVGLAAVAVVGVIALRPSMDAPEPQAVAVVDAAPADTATPATTPTASDDPTPSVAATPTPRAVETPIPRPTAAPTRTPASATRTPSPAPTPIPVATSLQANARSRIVAGFPFKVTATGEAPAGARTFLLLRVGGGDWTETAMVVVSGGWEQTVASDSTWLVGAQWYVEVRHRGGIVAQAGSRSTPRQLEVR